MSSPRQHLSETLTQAQQLQTSIKSMIAQFRELLEDPAHESLFEAESYLYDAHDCLQDFQDDCQAFLDENAAENL